MSEVIWTVIVKTWNRLAKQCLQHWSPSLGVMQSCGVCCTVCDVAPVACISMPRPSRIKQRTYNLGWPAVPKFDVGFCALQIRMVSKQIEASPSYPTPRPYSSFSMLAIAVGCNRSPALFPHCSAMAHWMSKGRCRNWASMSPSMITLPSGTAGSQEKFPLCSAEQQAMQ